MSDASLLIKRLSDFALDIPGADRNRMNVCIVSSEFIGPVKNTGIATVTSALAKQLSADGHDVTLLYTYVGFGNPVSGDKPWTHWVDQLAAEHVALEYIPQDGDYRAWRNASWLVKDFLGERNFDLVYFNDHFGSGYYSMLAKRAGMVPFRDQLHCVITHGSMEWIFDLNDYYATRSSDLELMGLERRSVEMADIVIAPSSYLLRQYESYGWRLPERTFHQPYPIPWQAVKAPQRRTAPISELVFFGRLEARKGLWLFCGAVDGLAKRFSGINVTFLGRAMDLSGVSSALQIVNRSAEWPFGVHLFSDFDRSEALSYLNRPGRLAVMPSTADNSPCAVYECMEAGIPFVTTRGSGIDELIDPRCRDAVTVEPSVDALRDKLAQVLEKGAEIAQPSFDPAKNIATWSAWHRFVAEDPQKLSRTPKSPAPQPALRSDDAALIFVIDNGHCRLSLLIDNLSKHARRFGKRAAYLVLSARPQAIHEVLRQIFEGAASLAGTSISILHAAAAGQAAQTIRASKFVFFIDAEVELSTTFFISALERLNQREPCLVSCPVIVRGAKDDIGEIEELPTGDLPGLAAVGEPIGGSAWAMSAAKLAEEISSLQFYDAQLGALASSSTLGQLLMLQCRLKGVPVDLLPAAGAAETRETRLARQPITAGPGRRTDALLGLIPSTYSGGPAWIGASIFGARGKRELVPIPGSEFLPSDHPFSQMPSDGGKTVALPELAAALGSADLSMQVAASEDSTPTRLSHLAGTAANAVRQTPQWNLGALFAPPNVALLGAPADGTEGEKAAVPQRRKAPGNSPDDERHALRPGSKAEPASPMPPPGRIYVDATRLRIAGHTLKAVGALPNKGAGTLHIIDVPLCGHTMLRMNLRSSGHSEPLLAHLKIIDQQQGGEIAASSARLVAKVASEFAIPLYNLYVWATITLELSGPEKFDLTIEQLYVR